jgi:hypothetical protein
MLHDNPDVSGVGKAAAPAKYSDTTLPANLLGERKLVSAMTRANSRLVSLPVNAKVCELTEVIRMSDCACSGRLHLQVATGCRAIVTTGTGQQCHLPAQSQLAQTHLFGKLQRIECV